MKLHLRRILALLGSVLLLFFGAGSNAAQADSPHFKHGGTPVCTVTFTSGSTASTTCTGTLAGLGNADVVTVLSVKGSAVYQCQNQGGNTAPGQNKVLVGPATSDTTFPASEIKNGNLTFTTNPAVLTAPTTATAAQAGCPNSNWTGVNPVLTVTSISLLIYQPAGTLIFSCSNNGLSITSSTTVALTCTP
jgi:hypothetical protein